MCRSSTPEGTPKHKAQKQAGQKHKARQGAAAAQPSGLRTPEAGTLDAQHSGKGTTSAPEATASEVRSNPNRSLRPGGKPWPSGDNTVTSAVETTAQYAAEEEGAAGGDCETVEPDEDEEVEKQKVYVINPEFPRLPFSVPLTYTLTMVACLCSNPDERPTFAQVSFRHQGSSRSCCLCQHMNSAGTCGQSSQTHELCGTWVHV